MVDIIMMGIIMVDIIMVGIIMVDINPQVNYKASLVDNLITQEDIITLKDIEIIDYYLDTLLMIEIKKKN